MGNRHMALPISKEGYSFNIPMAMATLLFGLLGWLYLTGVFCGLTLFVIYFFRNPTRTSPSSEGAIVSPADGKILTIERHFEDLFLHQETVRISIFMSLFNVHVNRIPYPGTVKRVLFKPGKFYSADKDKAALHNEYCAMIIATPSGQQYGVVQVAGLIARRIICWSEIGDQVKTGQRYGLIRFGSRVDLYLPPETDVEVKTGQKVKAGETILGRMHQ